MSTSLHTPSLAAGRPAPSPRAVAVVRALLALGWAALLLLALGGGRLAAGDDVPLAAALLLATYPLIDVVGSAAVGAWAGAALSLLGALGVAVCALGVDAGATLLAFGAWAILSGLLGLVTVLRRRAVDGPAPTLLLSGGLSALAGLGFAAMAGGDEVQLVGLAGYMAFGALLLLLWARRGPAAR